MARKDVTDSTITQDMEDSNDNFIELYNAILAATTGSGLLITTNDQLVGFAEDKLPPGTNISVTVGSPGGNETLTISLSIDTNVDFGGKAAYNDALETATAVSVGSGTHTVNKAVASSQQVTATGDFTLAFSGFPATGLEGGFIITAINWGAHTVTLPGGLEREGNTDPTWTVSGKDRVVVYKDEFDVYQMTVNAYDLRSS